MWTFSKPLEQKTLTKLIKNEINQCKKCGTKFELGQQCWFNKHNSKNRCYKKWYCVACYDKMFL